MITPTTKNSSYMLHIKLPNISINLMVTVKVASILDKCMVLPQIPITYIPQYHFQSLSFKFYHKKKKIEQNHKKKQKTLKC